MWFFQILQKQHPHNNKNRLHFCVINGFMLET